MTKADHQKFMRRTYSIYKHQTERAIKKNGVLDFDLVRLREEVARCIGRDCFYCHKPVTVKNFSLDHDLPVERGGTFGWTNNLVVCDACNRAKGRMTSGEFLALLAFMRVTFKPEVEREILGRLKAGAAVVRLRFAGRKK